MDEGGSSTHLTYWRGRYLPISEVVFLGFLYLYSTILLSMIFYTKYKQGLDSHGWLMEASIPLIVKSIFIAGILFNVFLGIHSVREKDFFGIFGACAFVGYVSFYLWG